jgi:hypothetical protein
MNNTTLIENYAATQFKIFSNICFFIERIITLECQFFKNITKKNIFYNIILF